MTPEVEFVWISHPATGGVALQPALAVDQLWTQLGWERVPLDLEEAARVAGVPALAVHQVPPDYVRDLVAPRPEPSAAATPEPLPRRAKTEA